MITTHSAVGAAGAVPSITRTVESGRDERNFARPVAFDGGGTHDQTASAGREVPQRDDRLARLAEAHVVGEDRAPPPEQERDAVDLVREEPVGERDRAPERRVRHRRILPNAGGGRRHVAEIRRGRAPAFRVALAGGGVGDPRDDDDVVSRPPAR